MFSWGLRLISAIILLQTLYFKFSGAPESVYIFEKMHVEPGGRYALGTLELATSILLILPRTHLIGSALSIFLMSGALVSHLTLIGITVKDSKGMDDGGLLFMLAVATLVPSAINLFIRRRALVKQMPFLRCFCARRGCDRPS